MQDYLIHAEVKYFDNTKAIQSRREEWIVNTHSDRVAWDMARKRAEDMANEIKKQGFTIYGITSGFHN